MLPNGVLGTGISAPYPKGDVSDFSAILDRVEALGVETIELPTFSADLVIGGRIHRPHLETLKRACAGRNVRYSVHGPLSINFFDDPARLPRHFEVLKASLEIAAEGDTVLIAGKGHEDYQIFADRRIHFDDREVAREELRSLC